MTSQDLREELEGNSERSQPIQTQEDVEARSDCWSIECDFIYRHHTEPRVHLNVPKEESFPIPLKYIDVTRTTHKSGCIAKNIFQRLLERRYGSNFIRFVDRIHEVHVIE